MSRHSKRKPRPRTTRPATPPRPPQRQRPRIEDRPKPPWHPIPLIETAVLVGIVCIAVGFFSKDTRHGRTLLVLGFALGSIGGLDTALREHFAGFRSHTLVLALAPAVALTVLLAVAGAPRIVIPILAVAVFGLSVVLLRAAYTRAQYPQPRGG